MSQIPRSALDVLFTLEKPAVSLGRATTLYAALLAIATPKGIAIRTRMRLASMLGASEEDVDHWIERLARADLVTVQVPSPYFVVRLRFWSSNGSKTDQNPKQSGKAGSALQNNVSVSKQAKQAAAAASKSKDGDGVPGEGAALLAQARAVLGENREAVLADLVTHYPAGVVRRALVRVRATPERRIRKSKLALFRYLLAKFSEHFHDEPENPHDQAWPPAPRPSKGVAPPPDAGRDLALPRAPGQAHRRRGHPERAPG